MVVYRHKVSKQWFIYIDEIGNDEALFVTPEDDLGNIRIIAIGYEDFDADKGADEDILLSEGLISEAQLSRFKTYAQDRMREKVETALEILKKGLNSDQGKHPHEGLDEIKNAENSDE